MNDDNNKYASSLVAVVVFLYLLQHIPIQLRDFYIWRLTIVDLFQFPRFFHFNFYYISLNLPFFFFSR